MTANLTALVARLRENADSGDSPISVSACMHSAADAIEAKDRALRDCIAVMSGQELSKSALSVALKFARQALGGSDDN